MASTCILHEGDDQNIFLLLFHYLIFLDISNITTYSMYELLDFVRHTILKKEGRREGMKEGVRERVGGREGRRKKVLLNNDRFSCYGCS